MNSPILKIQTLAAAILIGLSVSAQSNVLLERAFWKNNPTPEQVQAKIDEGNNPAELNRNAFDPMVYAILENTSEATLKFLLKQNGNDVNKITHDGRTYIFWAAYKDNLSFVKYLVDNGASTDVVDDHGFSVMNFAARSGVKNTELYDYLIAQGADATKEKTKDGANALLLLVPSLETPEMIRYFESKGLKMTDTDNVGNGIFNYAAMGGNTEMLEWLIENGATYKSANEEGENAVCFAAKGMRGHSNSVEVFEYLKTIGLDPNVSNTEGTTPMMVYASSGKDLKVFEFFLANGGSADQGDKNGATALMFATENSSPEIVDLLLENGGNPNALDQNGNTLVYYLVQSFNPRDSKEFDAKFSSLSKHELDIKKPQADGNTFYHLAANKNQIFLIKKADEAGLDVNAKNDEGMTPLHIAAMKSDNDEILKYLISVGADISINTDFTESAYQLASENELLTKNQIDIKFLEN